MTRRDDFVAERKPAWDELSYLVGQWGKRRVFDGPTISRVGVLYRALCQDIVRCNGSRFGPDLGAHLDALAARTHSRLYNQRPLRLPNAFDFVFREFPRSVRKNGRFFGLSAALFLVPFVVGLLLTLASKDFATNVVPAGRLDEFAESYKQGMAEGTGGSFNTMMAGFYVINNVGIAFRCFATGIFFGLGSAFFLVYNGLFTGCVAGYVTASGGGPQIWTYMSGHSPFEITAIILSGAAGLEMGYSLVATEGRTRLGSLRAHSRSVTAQIVGAALMLLIAATIEGYWSHSAFSMPVKLAFAGGGTIAVAAFLLFAGRPKRPVRGAA